MLRIAVSPALDSCLQMNSPYVSSGSAPKPKEGMGSAIMAVDQTHLCPKPSIKKVQCCLLLSFLKGEPAGQTKKEGESDQDHLRLLFSKWEVAVMALSRRVSGKLLILLHASLQVALATKQGLNGSLELNSRTSTHPGRTLQGKRLVGTKLNPPP